jgi:hypothetical protein
MSGWVSPLRGFHAKLAAMKSPRTWIGVVALAVCVTAVFLAVIAVMGRLVASRWMFTGDHALIWMLGIGAVNTVAVIVLALRKARDDRRTLFPKAKTDPSGPRRLAGPGGSFRPRRR